MSDAFTDIARGKYFAGEKSQSVRDQQSPKDTMKRYYGDIERLVYAAEILCQLDQNGEMCDGGCPFESKNGVRCDLVFFRACLGDHVIQHDPTNP